MIRNAFFPHFKAQTFAVCIWIIKNKLWHGDNVCVVAGAVSGDAPAVSRPGSRGGRAQDASGLNQPGSLAPTAELSLVFSILRGDHAGKRVRKLEPSFFIILTRDLPGVALVNISNG